jgi:hypothetical protein
MEIDPCENAGASIKCALVVQADAVDDARVSRSSRVRKVGASGKSCWPGQKLNGLKPTV